MAFLALNSNTTTQAPPFQLSVKDDSDHILIRANISKATHELAHIENGLEQQDRPTSRSSQSIANEK